MAHPDARTTVYARMLMVERYLWPGGRKRASPSSWASHERPCRSGSSATGPRAETGCTIDRADPHQPDPHRPRGRGADPGLALQRRSRRGVSGRRAGTGRLHRGAGTGPSRACRTRTRSTRSPAVPGRRRHSGIRHEHPRPGDPLHVDVEKLGRVPDGGSWRLHGRREQVRGRGNGYDFLCVFLHVAVDDHSRVACIEALPDERDTTCAEFGYRAITWFRERGVRVLRILTDNARSTASAAPGARSASHWGSGGGSPSPAVHGPTARPSGSTGPCCPSSPTPDPGCPTQPGSPPWTTGSPAWRRLRRRGGTSPRSCDAPRRTTQGVEQYHDMGSLPCRSRSRPPFIGRNARMQGRPASPSGTRRTSRRPSWSSRARHAGCCAPTDRGSLSTKGQTPVGRGRRGPDLDRRLTPELSGQLGDPTSPTEPTRAGRETRFSCHAPRSQHSAGARVSGRCGWSPGSPGLRLAEAGDRACAQKLRWSRRRRCAGQQPVITSEEPERAAPVAAGGCRVAASRCDPEAASPGAPWSRSRSPPSYRAVTLSPALHSQKNHSTTRRRGAGRDRAGGS